MKWFAVLFLAAMLAVAPGYASAQPPKDKSPVPQSQGPEVKGQPAGTAKGFTPEARRSYEAKTAKELEAFQQKIADIRVQATNGSPQKKRAMIRAATKLQMQKIGAEYQLTALKKASAGDWLQKKADLDKAMENLRKALKAN